MFSRLLMLSEYMDIASDQMRGRVPPARVIWKGFFGHPALPSLQAGSPHQKRNKKKRKEKSPFCFVHNIFPFSSIDAIIVRPHAVERFSERYTYVYPDLAMPDDIAGCIRTLLTLFGVRVYLNPHRALMRVIRNGFRPASYFVCGKLRFVVEEYPDHWLVRTIELA